MWLSCYLTPAGNRTENFFAQKTGCKHVKRPVEHSEEISARKFAACTSANYSPSQDIFTGAVDAYAWCCTVCEEICRHICMMHELRSIARFPIKVVRDRSKSTRCFSGHVLSWLNYQVFFFRSFQAYRTISASLRRALLAYLSHNQISSLVCKVVTWAERRAWTSTRTDEFNAKANQSWINEMFLIILSMERDPFLSKESDSLRSYRVHISPTM